MFHLLLLFIRKQPKNEMLVGGGRGRRGSLIKKNVAFWFFSEPLSSPYFSRRQDKQLKEMGLFAYFAFFPFFSSLLLFTSTDIFSYLESLCNYYEIYVLWKFPRSYQIIFYLDNESLWRFPFSTWNFFLRFCVFDFRRVSLLLRMAYKSFLRG